MEGNKVSFQSIDEYISTFPPEVQEILQTLRKSNKRVCTRCNRKDKLSNAHFRVTRKFGAFRCL